MDSSNQPRITLPVQAPPVYRDDWTEQAAWPAEAGVESAASGCGNLTGPARQMCYLQRYGITT
ncbi:hypothetical protein [Streptomyces sp. NBC_01361]|uniref:hypothetical protein n=1 Tax=Streptomyces sp. NBC_01361 TaxID=2903838 RepID=UPI002E3507CC|nr:hypothetical protein [Streptomyces sp. NBC_01361]